MITNKKSSRYFTYIEPVLKIPIIRTYGSLIFTILAMIIFILFAIKPTVETIILLQKDLENQKEIQSKLHQKITDIQTAETNLARIDQTTRARIESLIPKQPDLTGLIKVLEQSVSEGASISAIQFQALSIEKPATDSSKLTEINFTFNIQGTYDAIISVLQKLNTSSRLISVTNLVLNKVESSAGLLMSVSGKAYYLK